MSTLVARAASRIALAYTKQFSMKTRLEQNSERIKLTAYVVEQDTKWS